MPVMLPPGQGVTVALPGAAQPPQRQAAPPSPFRQVHGPDVVLMPHTPEQAQAKPAQAPAAPLPQPQPPQPIG